MISIFRRKYSGTLDLSELVTDMHSHLLPGIDDGSPDPDMSVQLIAGLEDLGYKKFITTPHVLWDMYKNDAASIGHAYDVLQEHLKSIKRNASIKAAAEYFMDDHFSELLDRKEPLLTQKENWVLVEFSFVSAPMNYKEKLFDLQISGYRPILAHPERYSYFATNKKAYDELRAAGCLFQTNLLSFTNYYGKAVRELADYLLKREYIDLLGTDLHHLRHLDALRRSPQLMRPVQKLLDGGKLMNRELQA